MLQSKEGDADRFVQACRGMLGVKFRHRGRNPRVGLDCAGLVIVGLRQIGLDPIDIKAYGREPHNDGLRQVTEANLGQPIPLEMARPGDVVLIRFDIYPHHLAVVGDYALGGLSLIHAYGDIGKVVEHRFDDVWRSRVCGVYRLPVN